MQAELNDRTVTAEIVARLSVSLEPPDSRARDLEKEIQFLEQYVLLLRSTSNADLRALLRMGDRFFAAYKGLHPEHQADPELKKEFEGLLPRMAQTLHTLEQSGLYGRDPAEDLHFLDSEELRARYAEDTQKRSNDPERKKITLIKREGPRPEVHREPSALYKIILADRQAQLAKLQPAPREYGPQPSQNARKRVPKKG